MEPMDKLCWTVIESVDFCKEKLTMTINFKSKNRIKAKSPNETVWDEFLRDATINLGSSKVNFITEDTNDK